MREMAFLCFKFQKCSGGVHPKPHARPMGVPGGGAGGAAAPPVCWANKASRAIFALQSGNIGLLLKKMEQILSNFVISGKLV